MRSRLQVPADMAEVRAADPGGWIAHTARLARRAHQELEKAEEGMVQTLVVEGIRQDFANPTSVASALRPLGDTEKIDVHSAGGWALVRFKSEAQASAALGVMDRRVAGCTAPWQFSRPSAERLKDLSSHFVTHAGKSTPRHHILYTSICSRQSMPIDVWQSTWHDSCNLGWGGVGWGAEVDDRPERVSALREMFSAGVQTSNMYRYRRRPEDMVSFYAPMVEKRLVDLTAGKEGMSLGDLRRAAEEAEEMQREGEERLQVPPCTIWGWRSAATCLFVLGLLAALTSGRIFSAAGA